MTREKYKDDDKRQTENRSPITDGRRQTTDNRHQKQTTTMDSTVVSRRSSIPFFSYLYKKIQ